MATRPVHHFAAGEAPRLVRTELVEIPDDEARRDQAEQAARQALAANRAFATMARPSTAAATLDALWAEAQRAAVQRNRLIKLLLGIVDGLD